MVKALDIARASPAARRRFLDSLSPDEALLCLYEWRLWAREKQLMPAGKWRTFLLLAGRGFGKTVAGAQAVRSVVEAGRAGRIALVAPTAADGRDVMAEGESGILAVSPPWARPKYEPSKRRITWPNGGIATLYSGEEPDRLRGPQHEFAWIDELAAMKYPKETWDMLALGLRLGIARAVVTTTPRPIPVIREIMASPDTVTIRGTTYENLANLAPGFAREILARYEGTRLGRQELYAEILEDVPGALWTRAILDETRVRDCPSLARIALGVDPAASAGERSSHTGIVACGLARDGQGYVLADRSTRASPAEWARRAVELYEELKADRIVAEANQGGDMVRYTIHTVDPRVPVTLIRASRGKYTRAEPVAALYEQGRIHHVGFLPELEDELTTFVPGQADSPDRLDAMVHALSHLMLEGRARLAAPALDVPKQSTWKT